MTLYSTFSIWKSAVLYEIQCVQFDYDVLFILHEEYCLKSNFVGPYRFNAGLKVILSALNRALSSSPQLTHLASTQWSARRASRCAGLRD